MIEQIILTHLTNSLVGVGCYMEVPENPTSESFVIVEKTGGSRVNLIDSATFAIQSYGATLYEAAVLNGKVIDAMLGIISNSAIFKCTLNSDYNYTDTTTKRYRYQAVFNLTYKEV